MSGNNRPYRVAVFEDTELFAKLVIDALLAHGAEVLWFIGATEPLSVHGVTAIHPDSSNEHTLTRALSAQDVDFVLTDGMLWGPCSGMNIVEWCGQVGKPCLAMSDSDDSNNEMVAAGARHGFTKMAMRNYILQLHSLDQLAKT